MLLKSWKFHSIFICVLFIISSNVNGINSWKQDIKDFQNGTMINTDTWNLNLTLETNSESRDNWTKIIPLSSPPPRAYSSVSYDSKNHVGLLFGGSNYNETFNDTWIYDNNQARWINRTPTLSPSSRAVSAITYDSKEELFVLFSGVLNSTYGSYGNDTWTYDIKSNKWTNMSPSDAPPGDIYIMAYDPIGNVCIAFGGGNASADPSTWTYSVKSNIWKKYETNITPPARTGTTMIYDDVNQIMVLFGGFSNSLLLNETWIFNPKSFNWTQQSPTIAPPKRCSHTMIYDSSKDISILFGGHKGAGRDWGDTWNYNFTNNTWTQLYPQNSPHSREAHQMFYDSLDKTIILFGGWDNTLESYPDNPYLNDTWCYNLTAFYQNGTFVSQAKDTGGRAYFGTVEWNASNTNNTSIEFQLRSADNKDELLNKSFIGPDGTNSTFYNQSGQRISSVHNDSRWIQLKAFLSTQNILETPQLNSIGINHNLLQHLSISSPLGAENWTGIQNITWAAHDDDNDSLLFDIYLDNSSTSIILANGLPNETREWSWNTSAVPNGTYSIRIVARDDNPSIPLKINATSGNFTIFHPPPPNHLPHVDLLSPPNNSIINNTSVRLSWKGIDLDGDLLAYIVRYSDNPQMQGAFSSNSTTEPSMNLVYPTDNKTYYWTVDATDGKSIGTDIPTVIWSFTIKINHLPRITSNPPLSIQVGESYAYNITAVDEDNDTLIFSVIQAPNSLSLNNSSGRIQWMPNISDVGNHTIIIRATDGKGGFDQQAFNVSVIPKPPPEKPRCVITYPTNGSKVGGMVTVKGTAANGSRPPTLIQVRIDGANWVNAVGLKNWTVAVDMSKMSNGKHKIEARSFDGNLYSDTASIGFNVYNPEPLVTVEGAVWWIAIIIVIVAISVIFVAMHQSQRKGPPKGI